MSVRRSQFTWPQHYCGRAHNPKYPCPAAEVRFGGVPASRLPACVCEGITHADLCPRRIAIVKLMYARRAR